MVSSKQLYFIKKNKKYLRSGMIRGSTSDILAAGIFTQGEVDWWMSNHGVPGRLDLSEAIPIEEKKMVIVEMLDRARDQVSKLKMTLMTINRRELPSILRAGDPDVE